MTFVGMKVGDVILKLKSLVHHEPSKNMGLFENESLTAHCQNIKIIFNLEF